MRVVTIGRSSSNNIVIDDGQVSRSHCQIIQDNNGNFRLIDANSANGTYVNGVRRQGEVRLNQTDIIRIGNSTLPWQSYFTGGGGTNIGGGSTIIGGGGNHGGRNNYGGGGYGGGITPETKPNSFLAWAILCTIFCCLPFGIVSIVQASRVDGRWYAGDYTGAIRAADSARTWFWWGFGVGLASWLIWIIYYIVVGVMLFGFM